VTNEGAHDVSEEKDRITIELVTQKGGQEERKVEFSGSELPVFKNIFLWLYAEFPCNVKSLRMK
jgi:hypothetical protein